MKYGHYWDAFYKKTYKTKSGKALWDVSVELSIQEDFELFQAHFNNDLAVLDIGCGTGHQSQFLSVHYKKVLGVDVSPTAVEIANNRHQGPNLNFQTLDIVNKKECLDVHERYGDMNIYMRGVIHQVKEADHPQAIENLSLLMGRTGRMYFIEVLDNLRAHFSQATERFNELPKAIQDIFVSNLPPRGITLKQLPELFNSEEFKILDQGPGHLNTNLTLSNGLPVQIPAVYAVIAKV